MNTTGRPEGILGLYPVGEVVEIRNRAGRVVQHGRRASIRLTGPIAGSHMVTDPGELRAEAARLLVAADALEAVQRDRVIDTDRLFA